MRWLLLAAMVGLSGCTPGDALPFEPAGPDAAPPPSQFGPFPVGVRTVTFEDPSRKSLDGGVRQLVTEIWYPATQATRGGPGAHYSVLDLFTDAQRGQIADAGLELPDLPTSAVRDAPLDDAHGPYPLVIFSHGLAAMRWQSTYYTVKLASHGYVVASTDHEQGTLYDVVRGQLQPITAGLDDRPLDVKVLMNRFSRLSASDPLFGHVDLDRIGVTGHSFGALTSMRIAAEDARVKAIVPQAPATSDYAYVGLMTGQTAQVPMLMQGARLDHTLPWDTNVVPAWNSAQRPRWLLELTTAGHYTFSDLCQFDLSAVATHVSLDIPGTDISRVLGDGCGDPAPPALVALPVIEHYAIGFFNAQLRHSPASQALLTQAEADRLAPGGVAKVTEDP